MATYIELHSLRGDKELLLRIQTAMLVTAGVIYAEDSRTPSHDERLVWAKAVYNQPDLVGHHVLLNVLTLIKDRSIATIRGTSDSELQSMTDASVSIPPPSRR